MHRAGAKPHHFWQPSGCQYLSQLMLRLSFKLTADWRPAQMLALSDRPLEAKLDPLLDHASLELGKGSGDLEHQLSRWRCGVDGLLIQIKINAIGF